MADLRISELPELTQGNLAQGDVLPITDVSASETKKVKVNTLITDGVNSLPAGSINSDKLNYQNGTIPGSAIVDKSITGDKIADDTITNEHIAPGAVGDAEISDVNGSKIVDGTVTDAKLAAGIDGGKLTDNTVTNDKLATGIDGSKLLDGTVTDVKLAAGIDGGKLTNGSVGDDQLAAGINGSKITDGTITEDKLSGTINGDKLADGTVSADKLEDIPGTKIIAGSMPANRLDGTTLNRSINLDAGENLGIDNEIVAATMSGITYNEQGLITATTDLVPGDLPIATTTEVGAVSIPADSGLDVSAVGEVTHTNTVAPGTTSGISIDGHGHVTGMVPLTSSDLPVATATEIGAIKTPAGGKFTVTADGSLVHVDTAAGTGPFTKVEVDSTGHVTSGGQIEAGDIPNLDADKITTGQFPGARIEDGSITSAKLADYATCYIQEDNPGASDYLGQLWYRPSSAQLYVYAKGSGPQNMWMPVGFGALQETNLRWGGTYDAATGQILVVTPIGAASGLVATTPVPTPTNALAGIYLLCQTPGDALTVNDLTGITHTVGDWIACVGETQGWIHIDVTNNNTGGGGGGATALNDLIDVTIGGAGGPFSTGPTMTLATKQILKYDGGTGQWRNTDLIDGGTF